MSPLSKEASIAWLLPGIFISVFDAWLSVQSMVGIMQPRNPLGFAAAIIFGTALTAFAVVSPLWAGRTDSVSLRVLRYFLLSVDIATSVVGALWYGMMHGNLRETVDFSRMEFDFANWFPTLVFVAVVLLVAWVCHMLGRALWSLNELKKQADQQKEAEQRRRDRQGVS
jgi:hypothetical protein